MKLRDVLFSSQGRIPRSTYWYFVLAAGGISIPCNLVDELASNSHFSSLSNCASSIIGWILFIPGIMVAIKRCHDRNRSGWFQLVAWIPIVIALLLSGVWFDFAINGSGAGEGWYWVIDYMIWIIIFPPLWVFIELGLLRGTNGSNRYGPDPLQVDTSDMGQYTSPSGGVSRYTPPTAQFTGTLPNEVLPQGGVKVCPYCCEVSLQDAVLCKYCGKELPAESSE